MTTERENDCHWIGYGKPASSCGLPFPETLGRWTNVREDVTCPACLTATGEPAVPRVAFGICDACEAEGDMEDLRQGFVMCKAGTGCNPRVVSGLDTAAATPEPDCTCVPYRGRDVHDGGCPQMAWCRKHQPSPGEEPVSAPGQSTPVETPPTEPAPPEPVKPDELCPRCQRPRKATAEGGVCCWNTGGPYCVPRPAAPAPGVGEGPRELTLAEACEAMLRGEAVQFNKALGWLDWVPDSADNELDLEDVAQLARNRYRLKPEPLPAPAPRVSLVRELVDEVFADADTDRTSAVAMELAERVVEATLERVRLSYPDATSFLDTLDRARAAMLEPKP